MQFLLQKTIRDNTPEHVPGAPNVNHFKLGNHLRSDEAQEARYAAMNRLKPQREKNEFSKRRQKQTAKLDSVDIDARLRVTSDPNSGTVQRLSDCLGCLCYVKQLIRRAVITFFIRVIKL
jgi:hypothetical protein